MEEIYLKRLWILTATLMLGRLCQYILQRPIILPPADHISIFTTLHVLLTSHMIPHLEVVQDANEGQMLDYYSVEVLVQMPHH